MEGKGDLLLRRIRDLFGPMRDHLEQLVFVGSYTVQGVSMGSKRYWVDD